MSDNLKGAIFMMCSMTCFAVNDAMIKALGGVLPMFQTVALLGVMVLLLLGLVVALSGWNVQKLGSRDKWILGLRALAEVGAAFFIVTALFNMELANVNTILQILPLAIPLFAYIVLGEPLGWRRTIAIGVGFLGMLLIIKPGGEGFNIYSIFCLAAVVCVTIRDVTARSLGAKLSSQEISFFAALAVFVAGRCATFFEPWEDVSLDSWILLTGPSVAIFFGYIVSVLAIRMGEVSFTAQFRYVGLLVTLVVGYIFFEEWPDTWSLIGSAGIVITGMFIFYRQGRKKGVIDT
jgi:S-adenosylmethionine uptake transporter